MVRRRVAGLSPGHARSTSRAHSHVCPDNTPDNQSIPPSTRAGASCSDPPRARPEDARPTHEYEQHHQHTRTIHARHSSEALRHKARTHTDPCHHSTCPVYERHGAPCSRFVTICRLLQCTRLRPRSHTCGTPRAHATPRAHSRPHDGINHSLHPRPCGDARAPSALVAG